MIITVIYQKAINVIKILTSLQLKYFFTKQMKNRNIIMTILNVYNLNFVRSKSKKLFEHQTNGYNFTIINSNLVVRWTSSK